MQVILNLIWSMWRLLFVLLIIHWL
jgi:hypothetical protein